MENVKTKLKALLTGKKRLIVIIAIILVVVVILPLACNSCGTPAVSSLGSYTVKKGGITTTVIGTGNLAYENTQEILVSSSVEIEELLVEEGEHVIKGQDLASVDTVTVKTRIAEVQSAINELDSEINAAEKGKRTAMISAGVSGRVKRLFAADGDSVVDIMIENRALAVISLDGLMAVDFECSSELALGDNVSVICSDKTEYEGTILSANGSVYTVTLTDNGPLYGDSVKINNADGTALGEGELYIYTPFNIVGASGKINKVFVKENQKLGSGATLFSLSDVDVSAEYERLLKQREDYVEELNILLQISKTGSITAPFSGIIQSQNALNTGAESSETGDYSAMISQMMGAGMSGGSASGTSIIQRIDDLNDLDELLAAPRTGTLIPEDFENDRYTGEVVLWQPAVALFFAADTTYTANVELTAKPGYGFIYVDAARQYKDLLEELYTGSTVSEALVDSSNEQNKLSFVISFPSTGSNETGGTGDTGDIGSIIDQITGGSDLSSYLGGYGAGSSTVNQNELLNAAFVIASDEDMSIEISVDELDILSIVLGQEAEIEFDAISGTTFTGTVSKIADSSTAGSGSAKYSVVISIDKSGAMKSGMSATATITVADVQDVITIPIDALFETGGETYVCTSVNSDGEIGDTATVETGISDGINVEILSGLNEGDIIYYSSHMSYLDYFATMDR